MEDDWRRSNFQDSLLNLYKAKHFCDLSFVAKDEDGKKHTFSAHKLILTIASPVFETMFYGSLPEKTETPIEIGDIDAETFEYFLTWIYGLKGYLRSVIKAIKVYFAADKYMVDELKSDCIEYIYEDVDIQTVSKIYVFAEQIAEQKLLQKCLELLKNATYVIIDYDNFHNLNLATFSVILDQDSLKIFDEYTLFRQLESYAFFKKATMNDATFSAFRQLVKKIRFLCFEEDEFKRVAFPRLLTYEEFSSILKCLKNKAEIPNVYPEGFSKSTDYRCDAPCSGALTCGECCAMFSCHAEP